MLTKLRGARSRLYRRKQASKQGRAVPLVEKKREETQVSARNLSTPDLILPVHYDRYYKNDIEHYMFGIGYSSKSNLHTAFYSLFFF